VQPSLAFPVPDRAALWECLASSMQIHRRSAAEFRFTDSASSKERGKASPGRCSSLETPRHGFGSAMQVHRRSAAMSCAGVTGPSMQRGRVSLHR